MKMNRYLVIYTEEFKTKIGIFDADTSDEAKEMVKLTWNTTNYIDSFDINELENGWYYVINQGGT